MSSHRVFHRAFILVILAVTAMTAFFVVERLVGVAATLASMRSEAPAAAAAPPGFPAR
jgi:hypothetical protein